MMIRIFLIVGFALSPATLSAQEQRPLTQPQVASTPVKQAQVIPQQTGPTADVGKTSSEDKRSGRDSQIVTRVRGCVQQSRRQGSRGVVENRWRLHRRNGASRSPDETPLKSNTRISLLPKRGTEMRVIIDSLRMLGDNVAIEDGRAMLEPAPVGAPASSKYTVVHVKVDGQWLMSTVRDIRIEATSGWQNISDLEWLIGTWVAEEHGVKMESVCRWVANKSFVERKYTVTQPDQTNRLGRSIDRLQSAGRTRSIMELQSRWRSCRGCLVASRREAGRPRCVG